MGFGTDRVAGKLSGVHATVIVLLCIDFMDSKQLLMVRLDRAQLCI